MWEYWLHVYYPTYEAYIFAVTLEANQTIIHIIDNLTQFVITFLQELRGN